MHACAGPAGLSASDASTGDHILHTKALPKGVLKLVAPFVLRGVQLFTVQLAVPLDTCQRRGARQQCISLFG